MRRRTFLATLPLAAAGSASLSQDPASGRVPESSTAHPPDADDLSKYQAAGSESFLRLDVHAGDRPSGASFASRSPALGCSGAAGTAHPIATQTAIAILKAGGSAVDA